jgi:hypothetical protein
MLATLLRGCYNAAATFPLVFRHSGEDLLLSCPTDATQKKCIAGRFESYRGRYADRKKNKTVDQPCVVVHGTTVPEHFYESLTAEALQDGFVARLLVLEGACHAQRQRVPQKGIPPSILEAATWWGDFQPGGNLSSEHPQPIVVPYTAGWV